MESVGGERGKEVRKRPAGGAKRQGNAKKILNRGNEPNKSFRINKSREKRTQNELNFEPKNAQITPKKRVLGGTFHVTGGLSADFRFPESLRLVAARPLTRPVPSGESAAAGHPLPQGGEGWNPEEHEKSQHKCTNSRPSPPRGRGRSGLRRGIVLVLTSGFWLLASDS
jgi:hypothetical protein